MEICYKHPMFRALFSALFFLLPAIAGAGVISGGGGGAFVCRNAAGKIQTAELLDLWEARAMGGQEIRYDFNASVEQQLEVAFAKLASIHSSLADRAREKWQWIQRNRVIADEQVVIHPPTDANAVMEKAGCPLEGMMYFDDIRQKLILKESTFFAQNGNTEIAASYFHEALYKALREGGLEAGRGSLQTRLLVGCIFSKGELASCLNLQPVPFRPAWRCSTPADSVEGEPALTFLLSKKSSDPHSWEFTAQAVGGTSFAFEAKQVLKPAIQTLPGEGNGAWGNFTVDESLRITGLETFGFPWKAGESPYGSDRIVIWQQSPMVVSHGKGPKVPCILLQ